jgi:GNAT superfamily N-acetyltransferase
MATELFIVPFEPEHFADVVALGNLVHGDNYLSLEALAKMHKISFSKGINASFVALDGDKLVGFRLTYAAGKWPIDKWCTPEDWGHDIDKVCYFKCNTVDESCRGKGIGGKLLNRSIEVTKQQGCTAGLSHIWLQSPGNSAFRYMSGAGGKVVKKHPNRWLESSHNEGYRCVICKGDCYCEAAEMILEFEQ